ncbi:DUF3750 domain-containing protein [Vibrio fluvialis]|uniref:DUF3750 domain-containing protein n=1 Tax=Vibrio fluvialis TaxID=676 RepID=UPI000C224667|nr:DUF3750 domain-containing protein [Vibrio fluvialis]EKO3553388.1 DUF3750 domain-containing protein [Vibrio fluvialis]EKO3955884.1 DUF3750 domain-containing protein [Vibrio fluvialis]EKO3958643.1 DUF3750 domain-containing protein [Vibrio fluvialis]EKO3972588.1 DUF3750 domain-containing protein [Vibrio fluvialis]ELI1809662.1 DUF3750 domain-containing protein [Vibrio fluvialis]
MKRIYRVAEKPLKQSAKWLVLATGVLLSACTQSDWRTASREPAGIAPDPQNNRQAVIEFYAADAFSWRGWFAVHTWMAVKPQNAEEYTVYEVVGWRVDRGQPALYQYQTATPDRYWYGARPEKVLSIQGEKAAQLIPKVQDVVAVYPWANEYTLFPGPNSNTFPAWVGRQVPELGLKMPFSAIGSGYGK